MNDINQLFFELIRVAIGNQVCLSHTPTADEWGMLYAMAKKQSLVGTCFAGVQKTLSSSPLKGEYWNMPEVLYLQWMGMAAKIQQRNEIVNRRCVELQDRLKKGGFRSYIMKGQANATLYKNVADSGEPIDLSMLRQSGDIDIYVEGGLDKVVKYVQETHPTNDINEVEIHYPIFSDTDVEIHYRPFKTRNPITNKRIQQYFDSVAERDFAHRVELPNNVGCIVTPTIEFNMIHQMAHIHKHLFTEGVGMRQLMDYYFVLKRFEAGAKDNEEFYNTSETVRKVIEDQSMSRFASALMWVLHQVFELGMINMPWVPNEKDGKILLDEVMLSGNFGKQDERMKNLFDSKWNSFWMVHFKTIRFYRFDKWAWFWSPLWRIYTYGWRLRKGYK